MYAKFTLVLKVEERLQEVRMRTDTPTGAKNRATVPTPSEPDLLWALSFSPAGFLSRCPFAGSWKHPLREGACSCRQSI